MNKKIRLPIFFLLVALLIACCAVFFSCGDSNNPVVAPQETVYKLDYNNVTLTEYHKEKIAKIFKELLEENARFYTDRMASASDIFSLASAGFGDLTGTFGLVGNLVDWCQPNYAKMDYKLEEQIQEEVKQMQTQLNNISGQITTLTANVQNDFELLFGEKAKIEQNIYTSSVENATQDVAELTANINNCINGSDPPLSKCLTEAMADINVAKMILDLSGAAINQDGSFNNSYSPPPKNAASSEKKQYYTNISQNYNNITSNASSSSVYTNLDSFYTTIQTQAINNASEMSTIYHNYNDLIVSNYIRSVNAFIQFITDISYVSTVSGVTWNNDIPTPDPLPTGYKSTSTFYNLQNYGYFSLLTLASIYVNAIISDVNIQDINCNNYTKINLSYPFQAPKYWANLPQGDWVQTCDIYRWQGLTNPYSGTWNNGTLEAACTGITKLSSGGCMSTSGVLSTPIKTNLSVDYTTLCPENEALNANYRPVSQYVSEASAYGYCGYSGFYQASGNFNFSTEGAGFQASTTCTGSCGGCAIYVTLPASGYFGETNYNTFQNTCPNPSGSTPQTIGIGADYHNDNYGWEGGPSSEGASYYVLSTPTGAVALLGGMDYCGDDCVANCVGGGCTKEGTLMGWVACFDNDSQCSAFEGGICENTDLITVSNPVGYQANINVTQDGCVDTSQ
jgi:hypothetical protein